MHSWFKLLGVVTASATLAVLIACSTDATPPSHVPMDLPLRTSTRLLDTPIARLSTAEPSPTHRPRQHTGEHIDGLGNPTDTVHFVDSFPNHSQTLTQSPARVGINFDVALGAGSGIRVVREGAAISVETVEFDPRRIYMSAPLPTELGDGLYLVQYTACFADAGCSEGQIGFQVDAAGLQEFSDMTGQSQVTIQLQDIRYQPNQIIISPGTTVTWVNDDSFEHFVNSDPHPSHNAYLPLNSLDIPPTGTFSFTFEEPGEYAFHCSAHVPQNMFGTILVRTAEQVIAGTTSTSVPTAAPTELAQVAPAETPTPIATRTSEAAPTVVPPTVVLTVAPTLAPTVTPSPTKQKVPESDLPAQRFAAHFVRSVPEHADLLSSPPAQVNVYFNFTLARSSNIEVRKDGEKLPLDGWELSENRLEMTINLPDAGAGTYHVLFNACWPDKSCHPGEFAFVVR